MQFHLPSFSHIWICLAAVISQAVCKDCPPLNSDSVDIVCEYEGDIVPCETPMVRGTKARLACKPSYRIPIGNDPGYRKLTCLNDGVWDRFLFNCIPECGTVLADGKPFVIGGFTTKRRFPWHVGIYQKNSSGSYNQFCSGTLVSADLVVSAAHCFYDHRSKKVVNVTNYAVAAGKYMRSYDAAEPYVQKSTIGIINITKRYSDLDGSYAEDISLLRLESPFTITTLVRPVCVDWENKYERDQLQEKNSGKIMGWGRNAAGLFSEELQEINLPFVHYDKCSTRVPNDFKGFITSDKFCAGYLNGSSVCDGDSGGGLCFQLEGRWFLRGIVSVGAVDKAGACNRNYYSAFTNVGLFLDWIREAYFNSGTHNQGRYPPNIAASAPSCILPEQPQGGSFVLGLCEGDCKVVPGTKVPLGSFLTYKCNEGHVLSGNKVSFCYKEGWYLPPKCLGKASPKYCPELISKSVEFNCSYQGKTVSCTSEIAKGTKATLRCKKFYHMPSADPGYSEITCLGNYSWDRTAFDCDPECGKALPRETELDKDGFPVPHGTFPWRVLVFPKNTTSNSFLGSKEFWGILISPDLVLTPASTIIDAAGGKTLDPNDFVVIAGQDDTDYDVSEPYSQRSLAKSIEIWPGYIRKRPANSNNLALIRLATPFDMTELVLPTCLDWDNRVTEQIFEKNKVDEVVESRNVSESQDIIIPFYTNKGCYERVKPDEKRYLRRETFCTDCVIELFGYTSEDMGDWFFYQFKGVWYLIGYPRLYLSLRDRSCLTNALKTYEKIAPHLDWIRSFHNASTL